MKFTITILLGLLSISGFSQNTHKLPHYVFAERLVAALQENSKDAFVAAFSISFSDVDSLKQSVTQNPHLTPKNQTNVLQELSNVEAFVNKQKQLAEDYYLYLQTELIKHNINTNKLKLLYVDFRAVNDNKPIDYYKHLKVCVLHKQKQYIIEFPNVYLLQDSYLFLQFVSMYEVNQNLVPVAQTEIEGFVKYKHAKKYLRFIKQNYIEPEILIKQLFDSICKNTDSTNIPALRLNEAKEIQHFNTSYNNIYLSKQISEGVEDNIKKYLKQDAIDNAWYQTSIISSFFKKARVDLNHLLFEDYRFVLTINAETDTYFFERIKILCSYKGEYYVIELLNSIVLNKQIVNPFKVRVYKSNAYLEKE